MIHAVILASIINSAYLAGVPALTDIYSSGLPITEGVGWTVPEFITLTKARSMHVHPVQHARLLLRAAARAAADARHGLGGVQRAMSAVRWATGTRVRGAAHLAHLN